MLGLSQLPGERDAATPTAPVSGWQWCEREVDGVGLDPVGSTKLGRR